METDEIYSTYCCCEYCYDKYDEKLFGILSYETVFTVLATVSIFILGILIDRLYKYLEKEKQYTELQKYFKHYFDKIIDKTSPLLYKIYQETYQNNSINSGIPTAPPKILTSDFQRIRNIQDKELFMTFEDKIPLSEIYSNIDFLELIIVEIDAYHKRIRESSDQLRKPLQELSNRYISLLAEYVEHVRINKPDYPHVTEFRNLVNDAIISFHTDPNLFRSMSLIQKRIVRPIQEMVIETQIFRADPLGDKIAKVGKEISVQYKYIKRQTVEFKLEYRKFSIYVKETQIRLQAARAMVKWR